MYTTLLMSTGLTFGTISALFGLSHGIIDQASIRVWSPAVIASAVDSDADRQRLLSAASSAAGNGGRRGRAGTRCGASAAQEARLADNGPCDEVLGSGGRHQRGTRTLSDGATAQGLGGPIHDPVVHNHRCPVRRLLHRPRRDSDKPAGSHRRLILLAVMTLTVVVWQAVGLGVARVHMLIAGIDLEKLAEAARRRHK